MPLTDLLTIMIVALSAILFLVLYSGLRIFRSVGRTREASQEAVDTARQLRDEWQTHEADQKRQMETALADLAKARREMEEKVSYIEQNTSEQVSQLTKRVDALRDHIVKLEEYLHEFFEVEVKNVFDSFDATVTSVLDQMKAELLRGVNRIEEIQSVVTSKSTAEGRLLQARAEVHRLTEGLPADSAEGNAPLSQEKKET